ncbi:unnamed protein product [Rangifer tarandus platyrhynchus]|uniref:Uncharacterized protein n=2 Tax=Rangifer tarandus platyrhynchus TaxID=3082113 RepID=A0ACB1KHN6_RANTA|nr:unnamed protein product [Rangifer tarandus platyrhynchus]
MGRASEHGCPRAEQKGIVWVPVASGHAWLDRTFPGSPYQHQHLDSVFLMPGFVLSACRSEEGSTLQEHPQGAQLVKNPPAVRETWVRPLGWEDLLEKGKAAHSSILAWRIPWTLKSQIRLSDFDFQGFKHNWQKIGWGSEARAVSSLWRDYRAAHLTKPFMRRCCVCVCVCILSVL